MAPQLYSCDAESGYAVGLMLTSLCQRVQLTCCTSLSMTFSTNTFLSASSSTLSISPSISRRYQFTRSPRRTPSSSGKGRERRTIAYIQSPSLLLSLMLLTREKYQSLRGHAQSTSLSEGMHKRTSLSGGTHKAPVSQGPCTKPPVSQESCIKYHSGAMHKSTSLSGALHKSTSLSGAIHKSTSLSGAMHKSVSCDLVLHVSITRGISYRVCSWAFTAATETTCIIK